MPFLIAFALGIVSGLRAMTAPAAVSWAAHLWWPALRETPLAFLGYSWTPYILSLFAAGELINDKLPTTPSRLAAAPLGARIVMGALCGAAACAAASQSMATGAILGAIGGVVGAYGGYHARRALTQGGLPDFAVALAEDLIAVGGALFLVSRL